MASKPPNRGFTLIEMLVISPIIILAIGVIISLMVNLIGDVLRTREQTAMTYDVQSALDQIEEDVRLAITIRASSGTMPGGYGSNLMDPNSKTAFTSNNAIIMMFYATDMNQTDPARDLIHLDKPNGCGDPRVAFNPTQTYQVIYYQSGSDLYRRTVLTEYPLPLSMAPCATPWQHNSCHRVDCVYKDAKVLDSIKSFSISYYRGTDLTVYSSADDATTTTVRVSIDTERSAAGRTVDATGAMRATKINN